MARFPQPHESDHAGLDTTDDEPEFFAIGTNPGTPVSADDRRAAGAAQPEEGRSLLRAHLAALAARSGLDVLGLDEGVEANRVRAAYDELLTRWHPKNFATAEEDVRELVAEIAIRIEHAYREAERVAAPIHHATQDGDPDSDEDARQELARKLGVMRQESRRSLARARDALRRGDVHRAAEEFECALELTPGCREAAAGLQLVGEKKRSAHQGSLPRILARGRR